jgi:DNA repair protein RadA/Sms
MPSDKLIYVCSKCDAQASKWSGRCFECGAWGTLESQNSKVKIQKEEQQAKAKKLTDVSAAGEVMTFEDLQGQELKRITADEPLAQAIFPQGLPLGSITLLGGEPGAGKSTLALQLSLQFTKKNKVLYFSSEESAIQIKEKVQRLGQPNNNFLFSSPDY